LREADEEESALHSTLFMANNQLLAVSTSSSVLDNNRPHSTLLTKNQLLAASTSSVLDNNDDDIELPDMEVIGNKLQSEARQRLEQVAERLRQNDPSFTELDIFAECIGAEGVEVIADALLHNRTIVMLFLGLNNIQDRGAELIAQAMAVHPTLATVFIRDNDIGSRGLRPVCLALLRSHSPVTELYLGFNRFTLEDIALVSLVLKQNQTLKLLEFDGNNIGDEGARLLSEALAVNHSLVELNLSNNDLTDVGGRYIADMLLHNRTLEVITLEGASHNRNHISDDILYTIRSRLWNNAHRPMKLAFLMGAHPPAAQSSISRSFFHHSLFDRRALQHIFEFHEETNVVPSKYGDAAAAKAAENATIKAPDDTEDRKSKRRKKD
jgi:hypothetical protein